MWAMSIATEILAEARELEARARALTKKAILASEEDNNLSDLAEAIYAANAVKRSAADLWTQMEAVGIAQLPFETTIDGGAVLTLRDGAPRKAWQHKDIAKEVAHRIYTAAFDFETGEMLKSSEELAQEILKYAGVSYWRVKELAKLGISADKYCEVGDPKTTIRIDHPK